MSRRILFVSGDPSGGAFRSTLELASVLRAEERAQSFVLRRADAPARSGVLHRRSYNLHVKLHGTPGAGLALRLHETTGRRPGRPQTRHEVPVWTARYPENALRALARRCAPEVVVVNSVFPLTWCRLRAVCERLGLPVVHYVREVTSYGHFASDEHLPDLLLANAASHVRALREMGRHARLVPSIVRLPDPGRLRTPAVVLVVNGQSGYGLSTLLDVARALPSERFALQDSFPPLRGAVRDQVEQAAAEVGNLELRPFKGDVDDVYSDAAVLMLPYEVDARPRVVLEAQHLGIPVVATAHPGLREAVGPGGVLVPPGSAPSAWAEAIHIAKEERHAELSAAAATHAARPEVQPSVIVRSFLEAVDEVVGGRAR